MLLVVLLRWPGSQQRLVSCSSARLGLIADALGCVGAFRVVPFAMLGARLKTSPPGKGTGQSDTDERLT